VQPATQSRLSGDPGCAGPGFEAAALRAQRLVYNADDDGFRDASLKIIEHAGKKGARLERLLQASFTRLAHDLGQGVVDPRQTQRRMFRDAPTINAVQLMDDINAGLLDVRSALQRVMPNNDVVDARTRGLMNVDVNEAISEVALSLERWRWMPRELGERHIFMNLPSYRMQMVDDGEEVIDMTVVIGSKQHPTMC